MEESILMKHYTVVVRNMWMCMKEDISGQIFIKRDNWNYLV